jgi:hypothetical protein
VDHDIGGADRVGGLLGAGPVLDDPRGGQIDVLADQRR